MEVQRPSEADRRLLVLWAADCAERVLPWFERAQPNDTRPREAIAIGRSWVDGEAGVKEARAAASAAHAAARAAASAAVTAHAAGHARVAAAYAVLAAAAAAGSPVKSLSAAGLNVASVHAVTRAPETTEQGRLAEAIKAAGRDAVAAREIRWQYERLPEHLRDFVLAAAPRSPRAPREDAAAGRPQAAPSLSSSDTLLLCATFNRAP